MNTKDYITPARPQYIQTTHLQPNKCNSQWYMHSHRIHALPTHNWQGNQRIFTASEKYSHTSLLRATQNSQARLPSLPDCFWVWWSNWPSHAYITHFTLPLASNLASHIKDTKHFLNLIKELPPLPPDAFLVTADATSLYTNIRHEEGIGAVIHFMEEYKHLLSTHCPPPHIVHIILDFILKHSTFKFMDTHINQSLAPPWELGWLLPMPIYSWARRNAP